ncbi:hypothetical protein [Methylobacterium sp. Gmos1]
MTHPPTDPEPLDIIARRMHEHARWRASWWPAWEDLDPIDPFEAGLIRTAYDRARDFVAMYVKDEG